MAKILQLKGWPLFWVLCVLVTTPVLATLPFVDLSSLEGNLLLTRQCNRAAVPFLALTFAVSSLVYLKPNALTRWLMQNRKFFGLAFAAGMGWQIVMIVRLAVVFPDYYFSSFPLAWPSLIPWAVFVIMGAMVLTSFKRFSRMIGGRAWRYLHKAGMYIFWAIFSIAYGGKAVGILDRIDLPAVLNSLAFGLLLGAYVLRVVAFEKRGLQRRRMRATAASSSAA